MLDRAMNILLERAEKILEANEGFDGEITAEQLVQKIIQSYTVMTDLKISPKTPKAKGKTCNRCGEDNLKWVQSEGRWTLYTQSETKHRCNAQPAAKPSFMDALKAVK
jgi:hypothetical protein